MVEKPSQIVELKNKFLRRFSILQIILLVLVIGYSFYFTMITTPVPNYNNSTQQIIYTTTSMVVKEPITIPHVFVLWVLIGFFIASFIKEEWGEISAKQAINITGEHVHYYKDVLKMPELQAELFVGPGHKMKRSTGIIKGADGFTQGIFYSNSWTVNVRVQPENEVETFYLAEVNARTGAFYGLLKIEDELAYQDNCPNCGHAYDVKYVITTDIKYLHDLIRVG